MDKHKDNGISLGSSNVIKYSCLGVSNMEKEAELYNTVYKEIVEILGLDAMLKIYLRFKGQQVNFPVRLYNPSMIQQEVIREYDGTNISQLAQKYDYSEKTIRRMIKDSLEEPESE